jgi:excisionase family DNA binding protein
MSAELTSAERSLRVRATASLGGADRDRRLSVLTIQQTADELQISPRTVERLVRDGKLGSVKVGRRRFVRTEQITAFLDHQARVEARLH